MGVRYLTATADLTRAVAAVRDALAECERVLGGDHPDTPTSRNNLAGANESAGDLGKAIPPYETTLADCERVLSGGHPLTETVRQNFMAARGAHR